MNLCSSLEPLHLFCGYGSQRNSISETELRIEVDSERMRDELSQQEGSYFEFWPGQLIPRFFLSLETLNFGFFLISFYGSVYVT